MRKKHEKAYGMVTPSIIHAGQAVPAAFITHHLVLDAYLPFLDTFLCIFFYLLLSNRPRFHHLSPRYQAVFERLRHRSRSCTADNYTSTFCVPVRNGPGFLLNCHASSRPEWNFGTRLMIRIRPGTRGRTREQADKLLTWGSTLY